MEEGGLWDMERTVEHQDMIGTSTDGLDRADTSEGGDDSVLRAADLSSGFSSRTNKKGIADNKMV